MNTYLTRKTKPLPIAISKGLLGYFCLAPLTLNAQPLPSTIELSNLDRSVGIVINGSVEGDGLGAALGNAGDINADGIDDILLGAPRSSYNKLNSGQCYIIYGSTQPFPDYIDLSSLNNQTPNSVLGITINGIGFQDFAGRSVSSAGDVNDDGIDDIMIGASTATANGRNSVGQVYIIYGQSDNALPEVIELSDLNGSTQSSTAGVTINGLDFFSSLGTDISNSGDINGDGIDDIVLGVDGANNNGLDDSGSSYVIFGSQNLPAVIDLTAINGSEPTSSAGIIINGAGVDDHSGSAVSDAGDINDDGIRDLLIGAPFASQPGRFRTGESYVIYGTSDGLPSMVELSEINSATSESVEGIAINGANVNDISGNVVNKAGDLNNDGIDDFLTSAPFGQDAQVYVIYGRRGSDVPLADVIELSALNSSFPGSANGFAINGIRAGINFGRPSSELGDINGDGVDDLVVADPPNTFGQNTPIGKIFIIFGHNEVSSEIPPLVEVSSLNGDESTSTEGVTIIGEVPEDNTGFAVNTAGDINGDGLPELLIGAPSADTNGLFGNGRVYLIFGNDTVFEDSFE